MLNNYKMKTTHLDPDLDYLYDYKYFIHYIFFVIFIVSGILRVFGYFPR